MFDLFGEGTPLPVKALLALIIVIALAAAVFWLVRRFTNVGLGGSNARGRQPRLAVIESGSVDGRRKLVIVRRDNVEHLIMIGGPTDVLIEANIVRGQAVSREVAPARGIGGAETLTRAVPLDEPAATSWPLAPEPGTPRTRTAAMDEALQWNAPAEPVVPTPPPAPRRPAPVPAPAVAPAPARHADTLAGLANELAHPAAEPAPTPRAAPSLDIPAQRTAPSFDIPAPRQTPALDIPPPRATPEAPAIKAVVPQPVAADAGDQNLADMAQRLEAALRRPGGGPAPAAPSAPTPPVARPSRPARPAPITDNPAPAPSPSQSPSLASAPRIDSVNGAQDKAAKPEPAAAPDEGGAAFGSLEQEMANLLGRPSGKT
jgi:hypothetical protein